MTDPIREAAIKFVRAEIEWNESPFWRGPIRRFRAWVKMERALDRLRNLVLAEGGAE